MHEVGQLADPAADAGLADLDSRIPSTYPLRLVQLPTTRLNENVSPGAISRRAVHAPSRRAAPGVALGQARCGER